MILKKGISRQVSKMTNLAEIREEGVILQVVSEWGPWSPCKQCIYNRGIKTSRGYCRLKRNINLASAVFLFFSLLNYTLNFNDLIILYYIFY